MSVTSSTDPRKAVKDLIDNMADADFTGSKPGTVEVVEGSPMKQKNTAAWNGNALYIWRPADGDQSPEAAGYDMWTHSSVVQVEAWTGTSADKAFELAEDVWNHFWSNYARDNKSASSFRELRPVGEIDARHEANPRQTDAFIEAVQIRAERDVEP